MTTKASAVSSLITNTRTFIGKNRFTPVFIILVVILGGLGATYIFKVEKKKRQFVEYRFQNLETMADKWQRILVNFEDRVAAKHGFVDSLIEKKATTDTLLFIRDKVYYKFPAQAASSLGWSLAFDEFALVIHDTLNGKAVVYQTISPQIDVIKSMGTAMDSGGLAEVKLQTETYQLYTRPVSTHFGGQSTTWHLVGLVSASKFEKETARLDVWVLLILITALLIIVMGFPLLKLIFINQIERLNRKDIVLAGISVVVGAPIVVVLFLSAFYYASQFYDKIEDNLTLLTAKVEREMTGEFSRIIGQLKKLEDTWSEEALTDYPSFKVLTKIDAAGKVLPDPMHLVAGPPVSVGLDVSSRSYFTAAKNEQYWRVSIPDPAAKGDSLEVRYVVRPVLSLEQNTEESVLLIRNESDSGYIAGSVKLGSVTEPVLPPGYSFMVVDDTGMVWYHALKGRSTLENLFSETEDNHLLKASLTGNIEARHVIRYHGKKHIVKINPVENTSLFVVSMYEIDYLRLKVSEILSLGSLGIFFAFLVTGALTVGTLLRVRPLNLYRDNDFHFHFLTPSRDHRLSYLLLSLGFLFMMLVSIFYFYFAGERMTPREVFVCSTLLMMWGYIMVYALLVKHARRLDFSKIAIAIVLVLFNLFVQANAKIIYFQVIIVFLLMVIDFYRNKLEKAGAADKFLAFTGAKNSYIFFLFIWLILTSVFPAFNYFIKSRQIENIIWAKHEQLQMAQNLEKKSHELRQELQYHDADTLLRDKLYPSVYFLPTTSYGNSAVFDSSAAANTGESRQFSRLLWNYRPIYSDLIAETQPLVYLGADNARWAWVEQGNDLLFEYHASLPAYFKKEAHYDGERFYLTSTIPEVGRLAESSTSSILLYLVLLAGILLGFYLLIRYFVYRIFGLNLLGDLRETIKSNKECTGSFITVATGRPNELNVFIIGTSFSGKYQVSEHLSRGFASKASLSMLKLDAVKEGADDGIGIIRALLQDPSGSAGELPPYDLFIIEYFEYGYQSDALNALKLQIIKTLQDHRRSIVILSDIYPDQILSFYQEELQRDPTNKGFLHAFTTWRYVFGSFMEVMKGIELDEARIAACMEGMQPLPDDVRQAVIRELGYGNFLPPLAPALVKSAYTDGKFDFTQLVANTSGMAHRHYQSIWNSLASREKYVVYDLAKDGFVNIKNSSSLYSLMRKGIVHFEDQPRLFNRSFRNHIMYAIDKEEALEMEKTIQKQGSWSFVRVILYLIVAAIAGFLLIAEPTFTDDFGTFITILAGLATIMPVASNLLGGKAGD